MKKTENKMKKRIVSLALTASLLIIALLGFSSCSKGDRIDSAIESTNSLTDVDADVYMTLSAPTLDLKIKESIKISADKAYALTVVNGRSKVEATLNGKAELEEFEKKYGNIRDKVGGTIPIFTEEYHEIAAFEELNESLTMKLEDLNKEQLEYFFGDLLSSIREAICQYGYKAEEVEFDLGSAEITVCGGYIKSLSLNTFADVVMGSNNIYVTVRLKVSYNNPGEAVIIK